MDRLSAVIAAERAAQEANSSGTGIAEAAVRLTELAAAHALTDAARTLKALGWKYAGACPKDGSCFSAVIAGCDEVLTCRYAEGWVYDGRPAVPRAPTMWRPIPPDSDSRSAGSSAR